MLTDLEEGVATTVRNEALHLDRMVDMLQIVGVHGRVCRINVREQFGNQ